MQIKDKEALTYLGKLKGDPNRHSKDKYCRFHRDHSHDTADCGRNPRRDNERPRPPIGDIRMIVGGTAVTRSSKKAQKTYLRMVQNV